MKREINTIQKSNPLRVAARRLIFNLYLARQKTAALVRDSDLEKEPFDADFYLEQYPDVATAGIDPYQHFVNYGRKEGRLCTPPSPFSLLKLEYWGTFKDLDPAQKTVLVVSHDASRTGAPILSLNIVRELKKKYNVITLLLLESGAIVDDFRHSSDIVIGPSIDGRDPASVTPIN